MLYNHAYIEHNGQKYYDFCLWLDESSFGDWTRCILAERTTQDTFVCDGITEDLVINPSKTKFVQNITPPKGCSVHIIPSKSNPYAMDDIRKNYSVKRNADTADYNVICDSKTEYSARITWVNADTVLVFPKNKFIFASGNKCVKKAILYFISTELRPGTDVSSYVDVGSLNLNFMNLHKSYFDLIQGKLTKPCVTIDKLNVNSEQELTADILRIVMQLGNTDRYTASKDTTDNFILNLNLLNQYNWRMYPGTMGLVFRTMMRNGYVFQDVRGHLSKYSKVIKDIINSSYKPYSEYDYKSEKDFNLSMELISDIVGIKDSKFATFSSVWDKLEDLNIHPKVFEKLFSCVVRIQPRSYGEKKN